MNTAMLYIHCIFFVLSLGSVGSIIIYELTPLLRFLNRLFGSGLLFFCIYILITLLYRYYFEIPSSDFTNLSISACILIGGLSGYFTAKYANLSPED